jgi:hypothetical protein
MEINQELFENGFKVGAILFIGFIIGILVAQDKTIKYDLNNDGKINLTDIVILRNYIMEEENGKIK